MSPRTTLDLDARVTVLEAAERIAAAPADGDIALLVASGAPLLRSAVFLEVLRARAAPRRLLVVTPDARARAVAASTHVPAYATVGALERQELDPTERLEPRRAPARAATVARPRPSFARVLLAAISALAAVALIAVLLLPQATVTVAASSASLGPFDLTLKGTVGGSGDITLVKLEQPISAKVAGTPTGERVEETKASGKAQLENRTTDDVRIPKGTVFSTRSGVRFPSLEDVVLPRSVILPGFTLFVGRATVPIEAEVTGEIGNVPAGAISVSPRPNTFTVTNPDPTSGGSIKRIPIVRSDDYEAALRGAPAALQRAGDDQLQRWLREPRSGQVVVPGVVVRQTGVTPASADVVGKEGGFELTVSGSATGYAMPDTEPRRAIAQRLRERADDGYEVADDLVLYDVRSVAVAEGSVTWQISARAQQTRRVDPAAVARLLAGRSVGDAQELLKGERLQLRRLEWVPSWWPLLPLLDPRITVVVAR